MSKLLQEQEDQLLHRSLFLNGWGQWRDLNYMLLQGKGLNYAKSPCFLLNLDLCMMTLFERSEMLEGPKPWITILDFLHNDIYDWLWVQGLWEGSWDWMLFIEEIVSIDTGEIKDEMINRQEASYGMWVWTADTLFCNDRNESFEVPWWYNSLMALNIQLTSSIKTFAFLNLQSSRSRKYQKYLQQDRCRHPIYWSM